MPVQKIDLASKKQQSVAKNKEVVMEEIKQLRKKAPVTKPKKKAITPRGVKAASSSTTKQSTTANTSLKVSSTSSKANIKKKTEAKSSTTVARRKKSTEKILKEPEVVETNSNALLFCDPNGNSQDDQGKGKGGPPQLLDFNIDVPSLPQPELQPTNPFLNVEPTNGGLNVTGVDNNPFVVNFDGSLFARDNNGFMEHMSSGGNNSSISLQEDIIFEEEEHQSNSNKETKASSSIDHSAGDDYYFPENKGQHTFDDDFSENESDSELFQYNGGNEDEEQNGEMLADEIGEKSFEEIDDTSYYNTEEKDEYDPGEMDVQEQIRHEIRNQSLRELDVKRRRGDESYQDQRSYRSIQSLDDDDEEYSDDDVDDDTNKLSTAERIQIELLEQNQKERELKEIHRSLSRENIIHYDSSYEDSDNELNEEEENDNPSEGNEEEEDTRTMILHEIEELKEREKEHKKRHSFIEGNAYDSSEEFETENDYEIENEDHDKQAKLNVVERIHLEMQELELREKELQKKKSMQPVYQKQETTDSLNTSLESPDKPGSLVKKPVFGSREDLVAYFGTTEPEVKEKTTAKKAKKKWENHNTVRIPKIFQKMEAEAAKEAANRTYKQDSAVRNEGETRGRSTEDVEGTAQIVRHLRNRETPNSKQIITRDQIKLESLLPNDTEQPQNRAPPPIKSPITPNYNTKMIAQEWERKSEEEKLKKLQIEREIRRKKEEYLKLLQEKARLEENHRIQQQERIREHKEKEREKQVTRQKKQGLNELWSSRRSLMTLDDNPDINDEDLLSGEIREAELQPQTTASANAEQRKRTNEAASSLHISRTIKRWETRIAKNKDQQ